MQKVLAVYGAGGLGREVMELAKIINKKLDCWEKMIFVVDNPTEEFVNGFPTLSYEQAKEQYKNLLEVSVGIGEPITRYNIFEKLEKDKINLVNLVHPDVYIPDTTTLGKGVTIQYGCFISCNVSIGDYVYIQPQANVGHNDVIGKGVIISGFCNLAGNVHIGSYSYLGISSCVMENINIGEWSIVGMASAVYKDIPDEMIAMGNPARPMRKNEDRHVFK